MKSYNHFQKPIKSCNGFTLLELLIAASIGTFISILTGSIIIDNIKSTAKGEALQRLKQDWNRATTLIESEIAISQSLQAQGLNLSDKEERNCDELKEDSQLKLRINLPGNLPDILYGTKKIDKLSDQTQWIGGENAGLLIRCGPKLRITATGQDDYEEDQSPEESIILDDLDFETEGGFKVDQPSGDSKLVRFELVMRGNNAMFDAGKSKSFQIGSGAFSRINRVPLSPNSQSICKKICEQAGGECSSKANDKVITLLDENELYVVKHQENKSQTVIICTNRPVIKNYAIDANPSDPEVKYASNGCRKDNYDDNSAKISGDYSNYVIDASPTPNSQSVNSGVTISGGIFGRNILLGTSFGDTICGGRFGDNIIGRNGNDTLNGAGGDDNFLPWNNASATSSTINGGLGMDSVYIEDNYVNYIISSSCNTERCELSGPDGGRLTMSDVEILVFDDKSIRLNP